MKTSFIFIRPAVALAAILLCTVSCHKDSTTNTGTQTTDEQTALTLEASAVSTEGLFDDAFDVVIQNSPQANVNIASTPGPTTNSLQVNTVTPDCTIVTVSPSDPNTYPKTITVDYGTAGCVNNNITRKGKIIATLSGPVRTVGTTISVAFQGYSVNGFALSGNYNIVAVAGTGGGTNFNISVTNGGINFPAGGAFTYNATETFTQTAGMATPAIDDDTYTISGNLSYSGNGVAITGDITTPLIRPADCANITTGVITFTYNSVTGTIDFGAGTCDAAAVVKAGSLSANVTFTGRLNH